MAKDSLTKGVDVGPENKEGSQKKDIKEFINKHTSKYKKDTSKSKKESQWYVFCSTGCGFCKKAEPVVEELNASGKYPEILKLDLADGDNQKLANELKKEYNVQCGTPWFINAETGKGICGFREKDVLEKWLVGEDIPVPPRPKGPIPRPPFHGAPEKEVNKWKEDYGKWLEENSHLPKTQTAEQILERPRPKTDPPKPPIQNATDEQLDKWVKEYDKWKDENGHLPNLQPGSTLVNRFKQQGQPGQPPQGAPGAAGLNPDQNARITRLEQKLDKLIKHLGVK